MWENELLWGVPVYNYAKLQRRISAGGSALPLEVYKIVEAKNSVSVDYQYCRSSI